VNSTRLRDLRIVMFFPHCVFDQLGGLDHAYCAAPLASRWAWTLAVFGAVLAPHASAVLITAFERGLAELQAFHRLVFRAMPFRWGLVAISVPRSCKLTRDAITIVFHLPTIRSSRTLAALIIFGQLVFVLGEEPGWRGFALPRLMERLGPNMGTLILGSAWPLWQLPLFVVAGTPQCGTPFMLFLVPLRAWSMVITLVVMHARGSTVAAMFFHASANLCAFTMWEPDAQAFALGS
jgi:uncharacterized protein